MSGNDRIAAYRAAEQRLAASLGIEFQERRLSMANVGQVRLVDAGPESAETLLFVHGGGAGAAVWFPLWVRLRGRRLLALDRPGCGLSGQFDYQNVDLRRHAVDVLDAVIAAIGAGPVDVVANSMGGLWSLWCSVDRPHRIRSVVQFGTPALFAGTGMPAALRLLAVPGLGAAMALLEPPSARQVRRLLGRLGHAADLDAGRISPELIDWWIALQRLPWYARSWRSLLRAAVAVEHGTHGAPLRDAELRQLTLPMLFSWSSADPFGDPERARPIIESMPSAVLEVTGHGHLPWLGQPDECARQVQQFLGTMEARS